MLQMDEKLNIEDFCDDLNQEVAQKSMRTIGRKAQISSIELCLQQLKKSNPLLIGEAGVGKTALVEGLAERINRDEVPALLRGRHIMTLKVSSMLNDTGQFGNNLNFVLNECKKNSYILFIDEIHKIVGAGAEGTKALDLSNLLKPVLARGEINIIGATTLAEYHQKIEQDQALDRRFKKIIVPETTVEETEAMLVGVKDLYEKHHNLTITPDAIKSCIVLAQRYVYTNHFPDKAFDILDEVAAAAANEGEKKLDANSVMLHFSRISEIPLTQVKTDSDLKHMVQLNEYLESRIKGQPEAVEAVYHTVLSTQLSVLNPERPLASFLFLGPTGVGKTEMAKALANFFFHSDNEMIRFDMSDYQTDSSVGDLLGNNEHDGRLINAVKNKPYSIILFDEVEKGNTKIYNSLLPLIDEGYLRDRYNRAISFKNCIIIMTSNLGGDFLNKRFNDNSAEENQFLRQRRLDDQVQEELKAYFKPEFINRLDRIVAFNKLNEESLKEIIKSKLKNMQNALFEQRKIEIDYDWDRMIEFIYNIANDGRNGARPVDRTISQQILGVLSEKIIKHSDEDFNFFKIAVEGRSRSKTDIVGNERLKVTAYRL